MLTGLLLGQSISAAQLLGAALVITGVVLAAHSQQRPRGTPQP
jgi:drug/metabolite transporter (DMT)-like permease